MPQEGLLGVRSSGTPRHHHFVAVAFIATTSAADTLYLSEIMIWLMLAASSRPAFGPCITIVTPFSLRRWTPLMPPTKAKPPPTEL